jgi:hypothetical protein
MTSDEMGAAMFLLGYLALLLGAIKVFGARRVVMVLFGVVVLAFVIAFKSLGVITGARRY